MEWSERAVTEATSRPPPLQQTKSRAHLSSRASKAPPTCGAGQDRGGEAGPESHGQMPVQVFGSLWSQSLSQNRIHVAQSLSGQNRRKEALPTHVSISEGAGNRKKRNIAKCHVKHK